MHIALLGPLEVRDDEGRPIEVGGIRLRALLTRLALEPGRAVTVDALIEALWGEDPQSGSVNALQSLVSRLRRTLGNGAIESQSTGYRLAVEPDNIDVHRFERFSAEGRAALASGDAAAAADRLGSAEALWRGDTLADLSEVPFAAAFAVRIKEMRTSAAEDRFDAELSLGRHAQILTRLEELAAGNPLRERLQALLIRALYSAGRQAEALHAYERTRAALADELGADPSKELAELHVAILRHDPAMEAAKPRTNLRAQLTSFVGRSVELAEIARGLEQSRLVTIAGPGGAGKTRLSTESAARLSEQSPGGTWFVELASVREPADVVQAVASAMGVREVGLLERSGIDAPIKGRDVWTRLIESFAARRALLILDNCEHVIDAVAELADRLLTNCPLLRILATSREPLGVTGETLYPIPPLAWPSETSPDVAAALVFPAIRLFVDRALAVRPNFALSLANLHSVVEICRRLDGMPLAIELAAARVKALSVQQIEVRLDDRFRLLTAGSRTALPRHQTLRAVVEWSWELLSTEECVLARRLSVFPAGATLESAERVCSGDDLAEDDVLDVLAMLVDKSLVEASGDGEIRYRMLETVRAFGYERLAEAGELERVRKAHAEHFLWLVETADPKLRGPDQVTWVARIRADHDNVLAAFRFAVEARDAELAVRLGASTWWYWLLMGNRTEGITWMAEILAVPGKAPDAQRAIVLTFHALAQFASGEFDRGAGSVKRALVLIRRPGVTEQIPMLRIIGVVVPLFMRDRRAVSEALAEFVDELPTWERAVALMMRSQVEENEGNLDDAMSFMVEAQQGFEEVGERWGQAAVMRLTAEYRSRKGDLAGAIAANERAQMLIGELGSKDDRSQVLAQIGSAQGRLGDLDAAAKTLTTAWEEAVEDGQPETMVYARLAWAELHLRTGDRDAARTELDHAMAQSDKVFGPPQLRAIVLAFRGLLACLESDLSMARPHFARAIEMGIESKDMPILAMVTHTMAALALADEDAARAAFLIGAAQAIRGGPDHSGFDLGTRARVLEALGDIDFQREHDRGALLSREDAIEAVRITPPEDRA